MNENGGREGAEKRGGTRKCDKGASEEGSEGEERREKGIENERERESRTSGSRFCAEKSARAKNGPDHASFTWSSCNYTKGIY